MQETEAAPCSPIIHFPIFPAAVSASTEGPDWPICIHKGSTVKGRTRHDFVRWNITGNVFINGLVRVEGGTDGTIDRFVDISIVINNSTKAPRITVSYEFLKA